jgi:hypothetical protein
MKIENLRHSGVGRDDGVVHRLSLPRQMIAPAPFLRQPGAHAIVRDSGPAEPG